MSIKKRLLSFGITSTLIAILLGLRLYYVQVYNAPTYAELALRQRSKEISLYPKRGIIYDRNLVPLTNIDTTPTLIIQKRILKEDINLYNQVLNHTTLNYNEFYDIFNKNDYLLQIPVKERFSIDDKYSNIFFVDVVKRYRKDNPLSHVIGYINKAENSGEYGLEKVYDEYLSKNDEKSLIIEYDKSRTIVLDGAEYVNELQDPNNPSGVKLGIDYQIQKTVEEIMDESNVNGAVVVAEVETGKILSLASRPNFNQDEITKYLDNNDMTLYNKTIQVGYPPGSIFKIVVLIASLESEYDFLNEAYFCKGYEEINNIRINCTSEHGLLTLEEAFAKSCNSSFIQIGKRLGGKRIIETAKRLGFGERINIGLLEEIKGKLPNGDELKGAAIGNISIGQGKIEATPLQITNLLMIIANNGIQKHMTIIDGITNKSGQILKEFNKEDDKQVISSYVAGITYDYLLSVVKKGTGKSMEVGWFGGAGGKTGSAEAILLGKDTIHGWFAGFFPEKSPKYVITVLVEEGYSGIKSAAPIFEKIAKEINKIYPVY